MAELAVQPSLFDRTLDQVRRAVRELATRRGVRNLDLKPDLPDSDRERLLQQMRDCLEAKGGDVHEVYLAIDEGGHKTYELIPPLYPGGDPREGLIPRGYLVCGLDLLQILFISLSFFPHSF